MDYANPEALVSTDWLATNRDDENMRIVDGSWHMPALGRDPRAEFESAHISSAVYFDIDTIANTTSDLPHMAPDAELFGQRVGAMGIDSKHHIVIYDASGNGSAARVWWMFKLFGHADVSVLDGGLAKWQTEGHRTASGPSAPDAATYQAHRNEHLLRSIDDVRENVKHPREQVLDARSAERFTAREPEPRKGLRGGHIPGSFNLPFTELYDAKACTLRPAAQLTSLFSKSGISLDEPIVTSCGSGVTACNLAFALFMIGKTDVAIYDGSWTEWGGREDTPIES